MSEDRPPHPIPPVARKVPHRLEAHGHVRIDDYYWLNRRDDPEVLRYLEEENAYTLALSAPFADLEQRLFEEIRGRIKQTDESAPYRRDGYFYYSRVVEGFEYRIHCRKRGSLDAPEEVLLDVNAMAHGREFFSLGNFEVTPGGGLLAWAEDPVGRGIHTIRFRDLVTGQVLADAIPGAASSLAWATDERTLFYVLRDPTTLRAYEVRRHVLGRPAIEDELVYREDDEAFRVSVWTTKSKRFVMIGSFQTTSTEYRLIDAASPLDEPRVLEPRARDHEYHVDHSGEHFFIKTNLEAKNFRLMCTPVEQPGRQHWQEVVPHRPAVLLEDFEIFDRFLVLQERADGLVRLTVRPRRGAEVEAERQIAFDDPAYSAWIDVNYEPSQDVLRYGYESLTTPRTIYAYDMNTGERTVIKREEVLGEFDPSHYRAERLWATAQDGVRVPISLVYRIASFRRDGSNPLLLYGYGAYGLSVDAGFASNRLSLLDRGFVWAIAHVRGGEELGREWYESGKLAQKPNTFADFIACAEHLLREGYTRTDRLFVMGASAGGLLVGAVLNMRPDLFRGAVAGVPFVDVVTTMLDESIPLTTFEYDEWGDPRVPETYRLMLSYSPYDNVRPHAYPALLVTTGLHDSQVQYWEPAKWVAKLRATRTNDEPLLLRTNLDAGHGGASGRYKRYREIAFEYAFLLHLAEGLEDPPR